jgi:hypothetical protein
VFRNIVASVSFLSSETIKKVYVYVYIYIYKLQLDGHNAEYSALSLLGSLFQ